MSLRSSHTLSEQARRQQPAMMHGYPTGNACCLHLQHRASSAHLHSPGVPPLALHDVPCCLDARCLQMNECQSRCDDPEVAQTSSPPHIAHVGRCTLTTHAHMYPCSKPAYLLAQSRLLDSCGAFQQAQGNRDSPAHGFDVLVTIAIRSHCMHTASLVSSEAVGKHAKTHPSDQNRDGVPLLESPHRWQKTFVL